MVDARSKVLWADTTTRVTGLTPLSIGDTVAMLRRHENE